VPIIIAYVCGRGSVAHPCGELSLLTLSYPLAVIWRGRLARGDERKKEKGACARWSGRRGRAVKFYKFIQQR